MDIGRFADAVAAQQQPDLVVGVGQQQLQRIDLEGGEQPFGHHVQQFHQGIGAHQLQLPGVKALQGNLTALGLPMEVDQLLAKSLVLLFQVHDDPIRPTDASHGAAKYTPDRLSAPVIRS